MSQDSDTVILMFHINEKYSIGFHTCFGAPESYRLQSAGDTYNCLVRYGQLLNKKAILDIITFSLNAEVVHTLPNGDYIDKASWKSNLTLNDFLNARVNGIKVIHNKFNIKHYLPYPASSAITIEEKTNFYENYKSLIDKNAISEVHNVKCLIWKVLEDEERQKRNQIKQSKQK
jgi:hypothetical protein